MRHKFNLDLADLKRFTMVIHGVYNVGKTYLVGDMLVYERGFGPVKFLNADGEDGWQTLAGMGLGDIGETVENYADMQSFIDDCKKAKLHALGVDSLRPLFNSVLTELVGEDRLPDAKLDGDRSRQLWGQARFKMEQFLTSLRAAAEIVVAVVPAAKSENEVTKEKRIAPDMYGAISEGCIGRFDFAGMLSATALRPDKVERRLAFQVRGDAQTRQRLANPITHDILLPHGPGGWKLIKGALEKGLAEEVKK